MVEDLAEVVIRTATVEDAEQIAAVHIASLREAYAGVVADDYLAGLDVESRTRTWRDTLSSLEAGTTVWVAQEDGRIVGFASLGPSLDEDADRTTLQIYAIYLEPRSWGQGIARELMRTVLGAVRQRAAVTLWVLEANERAAHFYRRNGFSRDGVERIEEIGGQRFTEVRYRRG